jgi:2-polyprenyl-3-methyl-5-hydroxy-6-metoxy-1,4-benzoquinol methylase
MPVSIPHSRRWSPVNEFTGERVIPGQVETDLWNEHFARYALASRFTAGRRVLDIGCGSGYGSAELSRSARCVIGLDVSTEAVRYASAQFPLDNLRFIAASASSLPFAGEAFGLATAFEVIEHLSDWDNLIREAHRVLADDGLFIVSTPNKSYYVESRGAEGENPYHVHEFEAAEFELELSKIFPHVHFFLQNRSEGIVFYPRKTYLKVEARLDASGGSAEQAHFFVALCSKQPIGDLRSFIYVPRAANVLREREQHIRKLQGELELNQQWLNETRLERAQLITALEQQKTHLEEQNRWALGLEHEWHAAQQRIVELQDAYAADHKLAMEKIAELDGENLRKTEWALETERRLSDEIERQRNQLTETIRLLNTAESTVEERTRWALDLQSKLELAEAQISGAKASRWVRIGRTFGVGPEL